MTRRAVCAIFVVWTALQACGSPAGAGSAAGADSSGAIGAGVGTNGVFGAATAPARTGAATWHTDFPKAVALATRLRLPLLLNFTGSDWCDWCLTLKTEVFDTPEFVAWARKSVILVEVDFPRTVSQDARLKRQNNGLKKRFREFLRDGYPAVLLLDPTGRRTLGELGYRDGGPGTWTDEADRILSRRR